MAKSYACHTNDIIGMTSAIPAHYVPASLAEHLPTSADECLDDHDRLQCCLVNYEVYNAVPRSVRCYLGRCSEL